jgi:hypothetical protein
MTFSTDYARLDSWIDAHFDEETTFLQQLIRVPTDTPPGNNAPHAERTAELIKAFGFEAEKHPVPEAEVRAYGMESITNLIVRRKYGEGDGGRTVALNAHGDVVPPGEGWTKTPTAARSWTARFTAAHPPSANAISRASPSRCARSKRWTRRSRAPSSCTSPTTRNSAAKWARAGCSKRPHQTRPADRGRLLV